MNLDGGVVTVTIQKVLQFNADGGNVMWWWGDDTFLCVHFGWDDYMVDGG